MTWDPSATYVLVLVGVMVAFVAAIYFLRRNTPEDPPLELTYSNDAWGQALRAGERIEAQVPVLQPAPWWLRINTDPTRNGRPTPRQLALTSNSALLVAQRTAGNLWDRQRYELSAISVENVKTEGEYHVSLRLMLPRGKLRLYMVPRAFLDRLRSVGARVAAAG
jgi:hypothetical protein